MRKIKWLVLSLILPAFPAASAQRLDALQSGVRVRIVTPKLDRQSQLARVVEASDDSVVFRSEAYPITRRLALADVDSLSVSAGQKKSTARYGLYGFVAGALSGAALGAAQYSSCEMWFCASRGKHVGFSSMFMGAVGGGIGALIGHHRQAESWKNITLKPVSASAPVALGVPGVRP